MDSVKTQDSPYLAENQMFHIALRRVLSRLALTWPSAPTVNSKSRLWSCGNHERTKVFDKLRPIKDRASGSADGTANQGSCLCLFLDLKKLLCLFPGVEYLMKT